MQDIFSSNPNEVPELHSAPVFYPHGSHLIWISENGEIAELDRTALSQKLERRTVLLCHRRWSSARAGTDITRALDIMELFAFVRPARFCLPTPVGLASQMGLARPQNGDAMAALLPQVAFMLLDELASAPPPARKEAGEIAAMMIAGGWIWGPIIL